MARETDRELLIRMEGKIDGVVLAQSYATREHEYLRGKVAEHSTAIQGLQTADTFQKGIRAGVANTVKVWWVLLSGGGGAGIVAVIAYVLRSKGF